MYAIDPIEADEFVIEYIGELIRAPLVRPARPLGCLLACVRRRSC